MPLLILLFILLPLAEIYVIIEVGRAIGPLWTILLLVADSIVGYRLLTRQGRTAWRRFQEATQAGRMPHREIIDGALIIAGGAFLLTPGFITDAFGLILLIPPTRAPVRGLLVRWLSRPGRMARVVVSRPMRPRRVQPADVVVHDPHEPRRPAPPELPQG